MSFSAMCLRGARMMTEKCFKKRVASQFEARGRLRSVVVNQVINLGYEVIGGEGIKCDPHAPDDLSFAERRAFTSR